MKNFKEEFEKYYDKIKNHEPFAFSRWADGELWILERKSYSLSPTSHGYIFPEDQKHFDISKHEFHWEKLWDAFKYSAPNYHIGITTGSDANILEGVNPRDWMIMHSGSDIDNITYANLFINSNYRQFRERIIPLFSEYKTTIMCNERSDITIPYEKDFLHEIAPNNTYLDMGSALNPDLKLSMDRGYLSAWMGVKQRGLWDMSVYLEREETW